MVNQDEGELLVFIPVGRKTKLNFSLEGPFDLPSKREVMGECFT